MTQCPGGRAWPAPCPWPAQKGSSAGFTWRTCSERHTRPLLDCGQVPQAPLGLGGPNSKTKVTLILDSPCWEGSQGRATEHRAGRETGLGSGPDRLPFQLCGYGQVAQHLPTSLFSSLTWARADLPRGADKRADPDRCYLVSGDSSVCGLPPPLADRQAAMAGPLPSTLPGRPDRPLERSSAQVQLRPSCTPPAPPGVSVSSCPSSGPGPRPPQMWASLLPSHPTSSLSVNPVTSAFKYTPNDGVLSPLCPVRPGPSRCMSPAWTVAADSRPVSAPSLPSVVWSPHGSPRDPVQQVGSHPSPAQNAPTVPTHERESRSGATTYRDPHGLERPLSSILLWPPPPPPLSSNTPGAVQPQGLCLCCPLAWHRA